jgi:hypothetical protein
MNYKKHYDKLIDKAKNRILKGYVEKHHIIPKCMGGSNEKYNIVPLTPEEHFLAHILLTKIYPENLKLIYAVQMMCMKAPTTKRNNKMYGWLRRKFSHSLKYHIRKKETKPRKKRILTEEHKRKIGNSGLGRIVSVDTKEKISSKQIGKIISTETKEKMSNASKGKSKSEEHKKNISLNHTSKQLGFISPSKGKMSGKNNPMYGKSTSKGKKWYTDGVNNVYLTPSDTIPINFKLGRTIGWERR